MAEALEILKLYKNWSVDYDAVLPTSMDVIETDRTDEKEQRAAVVFNEPKDDEKKHGSKRAIKQTDATSNTRDLDTDMKSGNSTNFRPQVANTAAVDKDGHVMEQEKQGKSKCIRSSAAKKTDDIGIDVDHEKPARGPKRRFGLWAASSSKRKKVEKVHSKDEGSASVAYSF